MNQFLFICHHQSSWYTAKATCVALGGYLAGNYQPNKDVLGRGYALTAISETSETTETSETLCK